MQKTLFRTRSMGALRIGAFSILLSTALLGCFRSGSGTSSGWAESQEVYYFDLATAGASSTVEYTTDFIPFDMEANATENYFESGGDVEGLEFEEADLNGIEMRYAGFDFLQLPDSFYLNPTDYIERVEIAVEGKDRDRVKLGELEAPFFTMGGSVMFSEQNIDLTDALRGTDAYRMHLQVEWKEVPQFQAEIGVRYKILADYLKDYEFKRRNGGFVID